MQWDQMFLRLGKFIKKELISQTLVMYRFTPTCIPVHGTQQSKLTLMSESLRNSGRIWVPKKIEDAVAIREGKLRPENIKEEDRDYYLERRYPAFGNLVPRDVASRAGKERCDARIWNRK